MNIERLRELADNQRADEVVELQPETLDILVDVVSAAKSSLGFLKHERFPNNLNGCAHCHLKKALDIFDVNSEWN